MKRVALVSLAAMLALAACSKKPETPGGGPTSATASVTTTTTASAATGVTTSVSADPPRRRAGLWEQTLSTSGMHQVTKICLDDSVEKTTHWWGAQAGQSACTHQQVSRKLGGGWEFSSTCSMGDAGTVTSHGVASGDFTANYAMDIDSTTSGSPMPEANGVHKMKLEGVWRGPCPADLKPGDMVLPGGMKMNLAQAMKDGPGAAPATGRQISAAQIQQLRAQAKAIAAAAKPSQ